VILTMKYMGFVLRIIIIIIIIIINSFMACSDSELNFWKLRIYFGHLVGLLGRRIRPLQGLYLHRTTQQRKTWTHIHASAIPHSHILGILLLYVTLRYVTLRYVTNKGCWCQQRAYFFVMHRIFYENFPFNYKIRSELHVSGGHIGPIWIYIKLARQLSV
jgi:hypothetical protein